MIAKASVTGRCRQIKAYLFSIFCVRHPATQEKKKKNKQSCKVIKALIGNTDQNIKLLNSFDHDYCGRFYHLL